MRVFDFDDYRKYLDTRLKAEWGAITRVANAANCQRSYLSRALKGEVLLTPDHLHGICEYWKLGEDESEYLMLLLEKARAATPSYRSKIERKIKRLRQEQEDLSAKLKDSSKIRVQDREMLYYSAWYWVAIHVGTSIHELQTEPAISRALHLPPALVHSVLKQLVQWGMVKKEGERWKFSSANIHLSKNSPWIGQYHSQFRSKAVEDAMLPGGDGLHYSQVQAMEEGTYREIKALFLEAIQKSLRLADPSKEEKLVAVTLDVFRMS